MTTKQSFQKLGEAWDNLCKSFREKFTMTNADDLVEWIVNDYGELGIRLKVVGAEKMAASHRYLFMYKGRCIEYSDDPKHDDGSPMHWRYVFKREFGEVCRPESYWLSNGHMRFDNFKDSAEASAWKEIPKNIFID